MLVAHGRMDKWEFSWSIATFGLWAFVKFIHFHIVPANILVIFEQWLKISNTVFEMQCLFTGYTSIILFYFMLGAWVNFQKCRLKWYLNPWPQGQQARVLGAIVPLLLQSEGADWCMWRVITSHHNSCNLSWDNYLTSSSFHFRRSAPHLVIYLSNLEICVLNYLDRFYTW